MVVLVLLSGCDVSPRTHQYTDLEQAVRIGTVNDVESLLKDGADPNEGTVGGAALGLAVSRSRPEVVRLLLSYGADATSSTSSSGSYLIGVAVDRPGADDESDLLIAEMLVDAGADPCWRPTDSRWRGLRPSEVAEREGRRTLALQLASMERDCDA